MVIIVLEMAILRHAQFNNHPIFVTLDSGTLRLPAITHVLSTPWQNEIRTDPKMLIRHKFHTAPCGNMCQIERPI